jgi:hypothetical protein
MTATRHYHAPDGTFRKILPLGRARREIAGWRAVADLLPVPCLRGIRRTADGCELVYDDVFASGRCRWLLADRINAADRDPGQATAVTALVNRVCDDLLTTAHTTGRTSRLDECVPDLYAVRLAPGGRLDRWYRYPPPPAWPINGQRLDLDDLARRIWVVQGRPLGSGWPAALTGLRATLAAHTRWTTAITQGDVTEPNITEPLCWLDFEHAGRNVLAGDAANLLWYLLGMGGWLVPAYEPDVYGRTLRTPIPPATAPAVDHLRATVRYIEIDYTWRLGVGRHAALTALLRRLGGDLGTTLAPGGDVAVALRPFLIARILGVIPLGRMSGPHAIACLAKVAELVSPTFTLPGWCAAIPAAPYPGAVRSATFAPGSPVCHGDEEPEEQHDRSRPRPADHARR